MNNPDRWVKLRERLSDSDERRRVAVRMLVVTSLCAGSLVAAAIGVSRGLIGLAPYWVWSGLIGGCAAGVFVPPWMSRNAGLPRPVRTVGDVCSGIYFVALLVILWCRYGW